MTTAQVEMRHKAKLRVHGWAGECSDREAEYIRGWLQGKMDAEPSMAKASIYSDADGKVTLAHARRWARGE